jgi:hypothetical protein
MKRAVLIGLAVFGARQMAHAQNEAYGERLPAIVSAETMRNGESRTAGEDQSIALASFTSPAIYKSSAAYGFNGYDNAVQQVAYHGFQHGYSAQNCCSPSCGTSCNSCCNSCCEPWWAHQSSIFGEVLYLWPGNSDLIYGVEQTDTTSTASPTGPIGITNIDESTGFRVGFSKRNNMCSSWFGTYARWDGDTTDTLTRTGQRVINSRLIHPSTDTVGSQSVQSVTDQSISFQTADAGYRRIVKAGNCWAVNWSGGLRYGNLEQGLNGQQTISTSTGLTTVSTDIDFDGFGILAGLDGERRSQCCGGLIYGKILGSLLAGDWRADYVQTNQFGGGVIANQFEDFRVTPTFDAELGLGWVSKNSRWKCTCGYLFSNWFNAVSTRDYIRNVRSGNLEDMADVLTFSGLTGRIEMRF